MRYTFEWDPLKAKANDLKHNVKFERAATVFRDNQAVSIYDPEHSEDEDRWITLGSDLDGVILVVVHTFHDINDETVQIRIISSRKATKHEQRQYVEGRL